MPLIFCLTLTGSHNHQLDTVLDGYEKIYQDEFLRLFRNKLGLFDRYYSYLLGNITLELIKLSRVVMLFRRQGNEDNFKEDMRLLALLFNALETKRADFTMTFR